MTKVNIFIVLIATLLFSVGTASAIYVNYDSTTGFLLNESIKLDNYDTIELVGRAGATGDFEINNTGNIQLHFGKLETPSIDNYFIIRNNLGDQRFKIDEKGDLTIGKPISDNSGDEGIVKVRSGSENSGIYTLEDPSGSSLYIDLSIGKLAWGGDFNRGIYLRNATDGTSFANIGVKDRDSTGWAFLGYNNATTGIYVNSFGMKIDNSLIVENYNFSTGASNITTGNFLTVNTSTFTSVNDIITSGGALSFNASVFSPLQSDLITTGNFTLNNSYSNFEAVNATIGSSLILTASKLDFTDSKLNVSGDVVVDSNSEIDFLNATNVVVGGKVQIDGGVLHLGVGVTDGEWCVKDDAANTKIEFREDSAGTCSGTLMPVAARLYYIGNTATPGTADVVWRGYVNSAFSAATAIPSAVVAYDNICEVAFSDATLTTPGGCGATENLNTILTLNNHAP